VSLRSEQDILADVRRLALEYYEITGKPLGVVGEMAECEAAVRLGLELAPARSPGYDATRRVGDRVERIQIKGRRVSESDPYRGRVPTIKLNSTFDSVMLVLLDYQYNAFQIWEAPREAVEQRLLAPGSKARNERGSMGISQFRSIAMRVWP